MLSSCIPDKNWLVFSLSLPAQVLLYMWDTHSSSLLPLLRLQSVCAAAGPPLRLFRPVRGLPQLPLLHMLFVVHVVGPSVRHSDECRGLHRHPEGGRDGAQRPAAAHTLDHAGFRWEDLVCGIVIVLFHEAVVLLQLLLYFCLLTVIDSVLLFLPSSGQVSARAFAFAFIADTCVVGFLLVSAFFFFHLFLMIRGQTTREWYSTRRPYSLGLLGNLRNSLGVRWYLCWLCPLIPSPLPGDGIHFQVTGSLEPSR